MLSTGCLLILAILSVILAAGCTQTQTAPATPAPTPVETTAAPVTTSAPTEAATTAAATPTAAPTTVATTAAPTPVVHETNTLLIATTTSLYDTKLLDSIQDTYEKETGVHLKITAQGTGIAIQIATRGDCDLLLVHSPSQEKAFIDAGYGVNQRCFAYNYFEVVGPASDPAKIAGLTPEAGFAKIRLLGLNKTPNVFFASRGDQSGTHTAEQAIWTRAGLNYTRDVATSGDWYLSLGKGMGETLTVANQKGAYTLTDEGTFLSFKTQLTLVPLITNKPTLLNRYSAIAVNPAKNPNVNIVQADRFINWLISAEGYQTLSTYGKDKYGKALFTPLTPSICTVAPFSCTCSGTVSPF
ncbi:MAG TPA: substrate-binding domain-containing protein [Methanomicrobiales archaeon]|nr:substrate-binding domain-containing protein [Methanomicrobiales archaeon]